MLAHLAALSTILLAYALVAGACYGWGRALAHLAPASQHPEQATTYIWLGWTASLFIFQFLNIWLALQAVVVAPVALLGLAFAARPLLQSVRQIARSSSAQKQFITAAILLILAVSWLGSRAMLAPANYDSGLYHFNTIRWLNSYPLVSGLGNLHGRLAFNQSFFTYVAALNFFPIFNHGYAIANGFLALLAIVTLIASLRPLIKQPSLLMEAHPFRFISVILALPMLLYLAVTSNGISAPVPDLACTIIQLVLFVMLAQDLAEWSAPPGRARTFAILLLAVTSMTLKLSNLAFASVIIGIYAVRILRHKNARWLIAPIIASALILGCWIYRGYIASGAPLFPSTVGYIASECSVPRETIITEAQMTYAWARSPGSDWHTVVGNSNWFNPWLSRTLKIGIWVTYPLILTAFFGGVALLTAVLHFRKIKLRPRDAFLFLPIILGLIYWFFTAPDTRFAYVLFWGLEFTAVLFCMIVLQPLVTRPFLAGMLLIAVLSTSALFFGFIGKLGRISFSGWQPIPIAPMIERPTLSGLKVLVPERGDQSWDAPLPSTPRFDERLRLLIPGDLGSGFSVTPPTDNAVETVHQRSAQ